MTSPFRLFSLPHVPLKQVLDNVGPEALLILSMCSRRSKSIAVSFRGPSKHVWLSLNFGLGDRLEGSDKRDVLLAVKKNHPKDHNTLETVRIGSFEKVPVRMEFLYQDGDKRGLITYWEDRITGLSAIGDYAREVFNQDISEMMIGEKEADDDHRRAAEWLKESQKSVQSLYCDFKPKIDNDLDFVMENFNCTERLSLYVKPSEHFCPAKMPNFKVDSLHILFSFWVKQDHLLTMNCKYIVLQDSKLTNQNLNVFVKHWMSGGCSQLKKLWVTVEEPIDYEVLLDGVEFVERGDDVERVFVDERRTSHIIRGGFDVKRSNVTATVVDLGQQSQLFFMIVW
ncbi:hypothetical protein GCK72_003308 [Caenorhabditis remanei]|uniref:F-box domain-containing protein n=1 Tax=Caenorhabditis remanei TaxID=31234 RepID=A0A6A5HW55_CAERE|nr:hypothetical protein GCK72_003308 [Caenorhabditis remanei]KAF1771481.1 hypothetical protein GCK72_003308 [Caenorhabditis remanei]